MTQEEEKKLVTELIRQGKTMKEIIEIVNQKKQEQDSIKSIFGNLFNNK